MEFNNFFTNLSLIHKLAPIEIPFFVQHSHDEKEHYFDFQTVRENTGNEHWNVLIVEMKVEKTTSRKSKNSNVS